MFGDQDGRGDRPLRLIPAALLVVAVATPAAADERRAYVGSFTRLRVQGPIAVTVAPGAPTAVLSGERAAIDAVEVQLDGTTLIVRAPSARPLAASVAERSPRRPIAATLATPVLSQVSVFGGAEVSVAALAGARGDVTVTGAGTITVASATNDAVNATVIGNGAVTLAGRAGRERLAINGAGRIDAGALTADELAVHIDGPGVVAANARYIAQVVATGLGTATVAGSPKCTVTAPAGAQVVCGGR